MDIFTGEVGVRIFVHDLKAAEGAHIAALANAWSVASRRGSSSPIRGSSARPDAISRAIASVAASPDERPGCGSPHTRCAAVGGRSGEVRRMTSATISGVRSGSMLVVVIG